LTVKNNGSMQHEVISTEMSQTQDKYEQKEQNILQLYLCSSLLKAQKAKTKIKAQIEKIEYSDFTEDEKMLLSECFVLVSEIESKENQVDSSISSLKSSLNIFESEKTKKLLAEHYAAKGKNYLAKKKRSEALKCYGLALEYDYDNPTYEDGVKLVQKKIKNSKLKVVVIASVIVIAAFSGIFMSYGKIKISTDKVSSIKIIGKVGTVSKIKSKQLISKFLFKGEYRIRILEFGYETIDSLITVEFGRKTHEYNFELIIASEISDRLGLGMEFTLIPGGSFMMGSPASEEGRFESESPQHRVTLQPFYMMTTEVTNGMWKDMMGLTIVQLRIKARTHNVRFDEPMGNVTWNEAQDFIGKLNRRDPGKSYRLPSEAEWEYACRAGTTTRFYSGNSDSDFKRILRKKAPNGWALYDMHGGAWEWCQDWYGSYLSGPVTNPKGPSSGSDRILRGGLENYRTPRYSRSANRNWGNPSKRREGFRVVSSFPNP